MSHHLNASQSTFNQNKTSNKTTRAFNKTSNQSNQFCTLPARDKLELNKIKLLSHFAGERLNIAEGN